MMPSDRDQSRERKLLPLLLLALLSVLGNYLSLPLFFGVDLIFGSIAVMLAAQILGSVPAVFVAFIGGSYTYFLWGHPYAIVIFACEALVVSLLYQRGIKLVIADLIYWLFMGVPLVLLFYISLLGMNDTSAILIAFKQSLNGLLNSLLAGTLILVCPKLISFARRNRVEAPQLENVVFHALVMMTYLASFIPIIYESYSFKRQQESVVLAQLQRDEKIMQLYLKQGDTLQFNATREIIQSVFALDDISVQVFSKTGDILFEEGDATFPGNTGTIILLDEMLNIWLPEVSGSTMKRWKQGYYFIETTLNSESLSTLRVIYPAHQIVIKLEQRSISLFFLLSVLVFISLVLSQLLSRLISQPLAVLDKTAKHIHEDIMAGKPHFFPEVALEEYRGLKSTLERMSETLALNFDQMQNAQRELSQKVKESTADLDDQLQHTNAILNHIIDGIITINEQGLIQSCNPAAQKIFGYADDQLIGRNVNVLMPNPYRDEHDGYLKNYQSTRRAKIIGIGREVVGLRADGTIFPMELAVSEVTLKEKTLYIGMVRDISERKQMEKMKSEFISTVSHELRTPLTAISGTLSLAMGGAIGDVPEQMKSMLQVAHQNSQRLNLLINDLLDMEKLLAGKMDLQFEIFKVRQLLDEAIASNQSYANQFSVGIELTECPEELSVSVDQIRFSQIMANLLSNAAKFSPEHEVVEVYAQSEGDRIRFSVKDRGKGIPEAFHERIFQKFSQADSSDTRQKGGTGLGLAITRELVERMHGEIDFNTSDQGTEFFFYLPCVDGYPEGDTT